MPVPFPFPCPSPPPQTGMVARASNLLAMGDFSKFAIYAAAYVCFVAGACLGGIVINYETFYLGEKTGHTCVVASPHPCNRRTSNMDRHSPSIAHKHPASQLPQAGTTAGPSS